ncbi:DUF1559 domain-containing protein [Aeoliella sp.]|uniref:DUF1559 family PulG-like putative transporter n=1 Tax=Aeoliella sp. TaxID=2795800 RepID=UPI003CCC20B0
MNFRLITVLYLFALLAASLAVFGAGGVLVAAMVFAGWSAWSGKWTRVSAGEAVVFVVIVLILIALLVPAVQIGTSRWERSFNNMKQLELALLNYHDANGHFPPPYVTDDEGHKLYSWRVLILPYLEDDTIRKNFHYDEPWDSPHNKQFLVDRDEFISPRVSRDKDTQGRTNYVAVVGPETMWRPNGTVSLGEVTDGPSTTVHLIEVGHSDIHWSRPVDVTTEQAIALLTDDGSQGFVVIREGYFVSERARQTSRCVSYVDGHVRAMQPLVDEQARALLTIAGDEHQDPESFDEGAGWRSEHVEIIIHWDHIWGVIVWLALVLLPSVPAARRRIWPAGADAKREEQETTEKAEGVLER